MLFLRMVINILFVPAITLYIVMTVNKNDIKLSGSVILGYGYASLIIFGVSGLITRYFNNDRGMQLSINSSYYTLLAISVSVLAALCFILITRIIRTNKRVFITVSIVLALLVVGLNVYSYIRYMPFDISGTPINSGDDEIGGEVTVNKPQYDPEVQTVGVGEETEEDTLYVIFTIDTEDNRGHEPYLIEGDLSEYGIEENCGVDYIMDTFAKYDANAVFFVNIYEHNLYEEDYMPELLRRIDERGNEVGLHAHQPSDDSMDFYSKSLTDCTVDEQYDVYAYGRDYIYDAIGTYPIAYRAGAYQANDESLKALCKVGFLIDSSLYSNHKNSEITNNMCHNQIFVQDGVIEVPVIDVFNGTRWRKLDLDSLSYDEIVDTLEVCKNSGKFNCVQLMFHSFSFMDQKEDNDKKELFSDGDRKIYGEDTTDKNKLADLLDFLQDSRDYRVITFKDYLEMGINIPEYVDDNYIYLKNRELAFNVNDISINYVGNTFTFDNHFKCDTDAEYRYVLTEENGDTIYDSDWISKSRAKVSVVEHKTGSFRLKCFVRKNGIKVGFSCYNIKLSDGLIEEMQRY